MTADLYPLQVLLVTLAGWVNRHQQHLTEYLTPPGRGHRSPLGCRRLGAKPDEAQAGSDEDRETRRPL
jgi:hypothetical protein